MPLFSRALALPRLPHRAPSQNLLAPHPARPFTTSHKRLGDDTVSSFAKGSKLGGGENGSHALGPDSLLTKVESRISGQLTPMSVDLAETQQAVKGLSGAMHEVRSDLRDTKKLLNKLSFQVGRLDGRLSGMVTGVGEHLYRLAPRLALRIQPAYPHLDYTVLALPCIMRCLHKQESELGANAETKE
ncbi:hypothetical protein BJY59DRAFT_709495 [Rhodotorula toruloides]